MAGRLPRLRSKRHRRLRSHRLLAVTLLVLLVLGGAGAGVGYAILKPRADELQAAITSDLQAGQRELEAGKNALTQASSRHDTSLVTQASADFVTAKGHFLAAAQLADNSRLLRYLELLPGVGSLAQSRHAAVNGIAEMGAAISDAGQELSNLDGQLIKPTAAGQPARNLLTVLDQAQPSAVKIRGDLQRAQKGASQVDVAVIPASQQTTFLKARDTIASALAGLDEFDRLVPVLHEVLGDNGARTYLIEQLDPSELRAGGGFIGTYSLVRADHGTLKLIKGGNAYELADPRPLPGQPGFIPQPGPYREVVPDVSWSFVDSNLYPDFPSNAGVAETFVQPRLGGNVDGVISFDYFTVAKMLELTGPMAVPGYGIMLNATNIIPLLVAGSIAADAAHKAIVGALAGPLLDRLATIPPDRWPALITAFNDLAAARHIEAYFNNASAESEIGRVGWSGSVNPAGATDYMMEVESNYFGDAANYYLTRHYTVELSRTGSTLHHKVTVDLTNAMPATASERTAYKANLRLYVGDGASSASDNLIPVKYPNPVPPAGTQLLDGWVPDIACCGGQGRAVFEYDTPWPVQDSSNYTYWQKQPGVANDKVDVTFIDGSGHAHRVSGDLNGDRVIALTPAGVLLTPGQPGQVALSSLPLG